MTVDLESAIQQFLKLGGELQATPAVTAEVVLERLVQLYRTTRVEGTRLDRDNDMLLLQWGAMQPMKADRPVDLRRPEEKATFEDAEFVFLDFTRQIFAPGDDEEAEFDDLAIQAGITLFYNLAKGDEPGSHRWISNPDQVESAIAEFRAVPLVARYLSTVPSRVVVVVSYCG
ncbi:MAG: hypothetical protein AB1473_01370 [Thermodesulfobacteriota bacterium]